MVLFFPLFYGTVLLPHYSSFVAGGHTCVLSWWWWLFLFSFSGVVLVEGVVLSSSSFQVKLLPSPSISGVVKLSYSSPFRVLLLDLFLLLVMSSVTPSFLFHAAFLLSPCGWCCLPPISLGWYWSRPLLHLDGAACLFLLLGGTLLFIHLLLESATLLFSL